ncbi:MAG: HAD family phosphatase [Anaerolineaceae bacterium]|nr:HAD family phosphatase [Anaerolineaceae bacterium]
MNPLLSFDAIVFDLDGVLVDTEPLAWDVYCEIFSAQGITLTEEQAAATIGVDMPGTARRLLDATGLAWTPEALLQKHLSRLYERFSVELSPFPGAGELVHQLAAAGIPLGVASNSPADYVHRVLRAIALEPHFKAIIGRNRVVNPKPHPDVYLEACRQLSAEPTRCLAIEDSQVGLQAALAAGLSAAWIHPPVPEPLSARVWRFSSIAEILSANFAVSLK